MAQKKDTELKNFVDKVCDSSHLRVETDLGDGYFRLRAVEAQRRQAAQDIRCSEDIVIEMLRNSRDAGSKNIFLAVNTEGNFRNILVIDDGVGIPSKHHKTIFEPYVTSKLDSMTKDIWGIHGRGMALYSISENCKEAYVVNSDADIGSSIFVKSDTKKLGEKKDQSSFPHFFVNDQSELLVRGPKNILRTCCEFAIENRDVVNVYCGSPVEIASTLYNLYLKETEVKAIFASPDDHTNIVKYLSYSADVHDFKKYAISLGIVLSKRTARRIMDGEIEPQPTILKKISDSEIKRKSNISNDKKLTEISTKAFDIFDIKNIYRADTNKKKIKISQEDKDFMAKAVKEQFSQLAEKYYLDKEIDPNIKLHNNKMTISFDLSEIDI